MIEMSIPVFILIIVLIIALVFVSTAAGMAVAYWNVYDDVKWDRRFKDLISNVDDTDDTED